MHGCYFGRYETEELAVEKLIGIICLVVMHAFENWIDEWRLRAIQQIFLVLFSVLICFLCLPSCPNHFCSLSPILICFWSSVFFFFPCVLIFKGWPLCNICCSYSMNGIWNILDIVVLSSQGDGDDNATEFTGRGRWFFCVKMFAGFFWVFLLQQIICGHF